MSDFNKIAPYYDSLVRMVFGNTLLRAGDWYLHRIPPQSRVLIIGGGTGKLLEYLNKSAPGSYITYVDSSAIMIKRAKLRQADQLTIEFINASIFEFSRQRFDYIITPFVMDLFSEDELSVLFEHLWDSLHHGGQWLFTDFVSSDSAMHKLVINLMYWFFGNVSKLKPSRLPDYDKWFNEYSMTLDSQKIFFNGLLASRVYLKE